MNIGGLPFLPNSTVLVETLVERLVENNPEDAGGGRAAYWGLEALGVFFG